MTSDDIIARGAVFSRKEFTVLFFLFDKLANCCVAPREISENASATGRLSHASMEHPAGFEPAISELQSLALPTWLRVHRMLFYLNEKGKAYNPSIKGMF